MFSNYTLLITRAINNLNYHYYKNRYKHPLIGTGYTKTGLRCKKIVGMKAQETCFVVETGVYDLKHNKTGSFRTNHSLYMLKNTGCFPKRSQ